MFIMVLKFNFSADLLFDILHNAMDVLSYLFLVIFHLLGILIYLNLKSIKE